MALKNNRTLEAMRAMGSVASDRYGLAKESLT
jgi:hypothetical protein